MLKSYPIIGGVLRRSESDSLFRDNAFLKDFIKVYCFPIPKVLVPIVLRFRGGFSEPYA